MSVIQIRVGGRYSVYRVYRDGAFVWSNDGLATQRSCGTHASFAVRVLDVRTINTLAVDSAGRTHVIPVHAFGDRIPDTEFLPGVEITINGRPYTVETAADETTWHAWGCALASYTVRASRGTRKTLLCRHSDGWRFGQAGRAVLVNDPVFTRAWAASRG